MNIKISIPCIFLLLLYACENQKDTEIDKPITGKNSEDILSAFQNAYSHNSDSLLSIILDEWNQEFSAKEISTLSDDAEKAIYSLFSDFYNPFNIDKYGEHEWGNNMYEGYNYAIVQNSILYYISDEEPDYENPDTIIDFRPSINLDGKKILYLCPNYHEALLCFLDPEYNPDENRPIFEPVCEEGWDHFEFLEPALAILPGHWGGYWHIETHPFISSVEFNNSLTEARLYFRIGYMFGEATYKKDGNTWSMTSTAITGIEK